VYLPHPLHVMDEIVAAVKGSPHSFEQMAAISCFQRSDLVRFAVNISSFQAIRFPVIDSVIII